MDIHEGLARTRRVSAVDPMSIDYYVPAWHGYGTEEKLALIQAVIEMLESGQELAEDELRSFQELLQHENECRLRDARRRRFDRYAYGEYTTLRGVRLLELRARWWRLQAANSSGTSSGTKSGV